MKPEFTEDELLEVNDALAEVIDRMCKSGQTDTEIKYGSLRVMWAAKKKIALAMFGDNTTPGIKEQEEAVLQAIKAPKALQREHAYR
jgi:hypothetical protein